MSVNTGFGNSSIAAPTPTFQPNYTAWCRAFVTPAYATWVAATSYPAVGTTYLVVDPNTNQTSTSVTCTPSILKEQQATNSVQLGQWMGATLGEDCKLHAPYFAPERRSVAYTTATWPGPSAVMDLGNIMRIRLTVDDLYYTLPPGPQFYTGAISSTATTSSYFTSSKWYYSSDTTYYMAGLSTMYPSISWLSKLCTEVQFETAPNTLRYATFLTQTSTLPRTTSGLHLVTDGPVASPTAAPLPTPDAPQPSPSRNDAGAAPIAVPTASPVDGASEPNPAPDSPANDSNPPDHAQNSGHGEPIPGSLQNPAKPETLPGSPSANNAPNGPTQGQITAHPALVLPNSQTLAAGSSVATVSGRLIFLDNQGVVHIAPSPSPGQAVSHAQATAISIEQIAEKGGVEAQGTWIPLRSAEAGQQGSGSQGGSNGAGGTGTEMSSSGSGSQQGTDAGASSQNPSDASGSTGSGSVAGDIGQAINSFGTWIMSGLGVSVASTGGGKDAGSASGAAGVAAAASATKGSSLGGSGSGQNGGVGRNSTVVPFTGDAAHVGTGLSALAFFIGVAAWIL